MKKISVDKLIDQSPEARGRATWNYRMMRSLRQEMMWRVLACTLAVMLTLTVVTSYRHMSERKYIPYVVQVQERAGGAEIAFRGVIEPGTSRELTDALSMYVLRVFIENTRVVPRDRRELTRRQKTAFYHVGGPVADRLVAMMLSTDEDGPTAILTSGARREVTISEFLKISEGTWQVNWREDVWREGTLISTTMMAGTFSLAVADPPTDEHVLENPFGLFIEDYHLSRRGI